MGQKRNGAVCTFIFESIVRRSNRCASR